MIQEADQVVETKLYPCYVCGETECFELLRVRGRRGVSWVPDQHIISACAGCGLVSINPRMGEDDISKYYALEDRKKIKLSPVEMLPEQWSHLKAYADFLENAIQPESLRGKSILDAGCGLGLFCRLLTAREAICTGLEISQEALAVAHHWKGVEVLHGWIGDETFLGDRCWDIVTSLAVIEHVHNPVEFMVRLAKLTRPGGFIYINTPDAAAPLLTGGWDTYFKFVHTYYFTETSLTNVIRRAGLDMVANWRQRPFLKKRSVLHPLNAYMGMLHFLIRVPDAGAYSIDFSPRRELPYTVLSAAKRSWSSDLWMRSWRRLWQTLPARIRIAKDRLFPLRFFGHDLAFEPTQLRFVDPLLARSERDEKIQSHSCR